MNLPTPRANRREAEPAAGDPVRTRYAALHPPRSTIATASRQPATRHASLTQQRDNRRDTCACSWWSTACAHVAHAAHLGPHPRTRCARTGLFVGATRVGIARALPLRSNACGASRTHPSHLSHPSHTCRDRSHTLHTHRPSRTHAT